MCTIMVLAQKTQRISMTWNDVQFCKSCILWPRKHISRRAKVAALWREHGGIDLAKQLGRHDDMSEEMRIELSA